MLPALTFKEPGAIAFSLGFRLEFFAYLPAAGFGFGAMALMGQNMGAKNKQRVQESIHQGHGIHILKCFCTGIGSSFILKPDYSRIHRGRIGYGICEFVYVDGGI